MKDVTPSSKLSTAQRRVAVERAFKSASNAYQGKQSVAPEGIAAGIANARMPQSPLTPSPMMQQSLPMEQPFQNMQGQPVDVMQEVIENNRTQSPPELSDVDGQIQSALIADQLWKDSGGNESVGAQVWSNYKKASGDNHLDSARDYFISSFIKWRNDASGYARKHPREARLLSALMDEFEASQPEGIGG